MSSRHRIGIVQNMDWNGLDWTRLDWTGLDSWTGLDNLILRVFTSATRATAKTLTQAGHVAPKFWVLDIRT